MTQQREEADEVGGWMSGVWCMVYSVWSRCFACGLLVGLGDGA